MSGDSCSARAAPLPPVSVPKINTPSQRSADNWRAQYEREQEELEGLAAQLKEMQSRSAEAQKTARGKLQHRWEDAAQRKNAILGPLKSSRVRGVWPRWSSALAAPPAILDARGVPLIAKPLRPGDCADCARRSGGRACLVLSRGILCMYTHPMLHTVTTGLCTVVPVAPVPVGNYVGTWFVSFCVV